MKKIALGLVFIATIISASTLRVGTCSGATHNTVQSAIDSADAGDTIEICAGTYDENVDVNESNLTIKGIDGQAIDDVVIDGGNDTAITIGDENETFSNFKVSSDDKGIYGDGNGSYIFKNLIVSSGDIGIDVESGTKVSCDNLEVNSSDDTGILIRNADGNHTFNNITVNSKNHSIYVQDGGKSFTNLDLNSTDGLGLTIVNTPTNLTFYNIIVQSKLQGIYTDSNATGMKDFNDINVTSSADGIYVGAGPKISFDNIDVNSSDGKGISIGYYARGKHTLNNIKISSSEDSIYARKGFALIKDANLTSSEGFGIVEYAYIDTNISNVQIDSNKTGIMFYSGDDVNISIECSTLTSTTPENGIYVSKAKNVNVDSVHIKKAKRGIEVTNNVDNVIFKNNKIENTTDYALDVNSSTSGSATINNNCLSGDELAYSSSDGFDFDGNYWDGVSDVDGDGKITSTDSSKIGSDVVDNSPNSSCKASGCSENTSSQNKNYAFDAWDTFRSIDDRNISTEIVNQNFNLTVAALDENGTNYQEFNGTVCATVDNNTSKLDFRDQNITTATFNINRGIKDAKVHISWKKNVDESCPLSDCNETNSSDNFAIRPKTFGIDINTTSFYAGVPFHIDINATNFDGKNTKDYNETNGTSFVFDINDSNATCSAGVLGGLPNPLKFNDGSISFDTNYSDVGDINFSVKEINGSEFALIDEDDTNDSQRLISEFSKKITVNPYQFAIVDYNFIRNPEQDWRYMSDVNDSNITLTFKIQSQNFLGNITPKFDSKCYSKDVNFTIDLNSTNSDGNVSYFQSINNQISYGHDRNLSDFNLTGTINDGNFSDGNSSKVIYALNIYRKYNTSKNPLSLQVVDINTTYPSDINAKNPGLTLENNTSKFYYARIKTDDVNTNKHTIKHSIDIEVFSSTVLSGFKRNSLSWYQMYKDNNTTNINFQAKKDFSMNSTKNDVNISAPNIDKGLIDFNITNSWSNPDSAYIHLKIPKYLWYSRYNAYSDDNSSDCGSHPCFKYNYLQKSSQTSVNITSGDFNGTDIGNDYNASKVTKKGVKVFR